MLKTKFQLQGYPELLKNIEKSIKFSVGCELVDNIVGGIISGHLHAIIGASGSGKTWFCLKTIRSILKYNSLVKVGYIDFSANLRSHNLNIMLPERKLIDQIDFFQPTNLFESIIFSKSLLEETNYDLLVFDTIFGSPLQILEILKEKGGNWKYNNFSFILGLRRIAKKNDIPILVTHSLSSESNNYLHDYGVSQMEPFISFKFILHRSENERLMDTYFLDQFLGTEPINLYQRGESIH